MSSDRSWYRRVVQDPDDFSPVLEAIDYFDAQYAQACTEVDVRGRRLEEIEKQLPGIVGYRYAQLQELESIMDYLEIREKAVLGTKRRHYLEHYNRALSDRMVEKFAEADQEVIAIAELRNHVAAVRNRFVALSRQHEYLHFQLGNVTKLRVAGIEDAIL